MGYYTRYTLTTKPEVNDFLSYIKNKDSPDLCSYGNDFLLNICENNSDDTKWYEHNKDMKEISLKFPDVLFTLNGEGEETGDIWRKYFKNGKIFFYFRNL